MTLDAYKASLAETMRLDEEIAALDTDLERTAVALEDARSRLSRAQVALGDGEARLREVRRLLAIEKASLDRKAVSAYIAGNSRQSQLEIVLAASELRELESTQAYSSAITDDQLDTVARVKRLDAEATALRDELARAEADIRGSRDAIARHEADLSAKRAQVAALRAQQEAETARQHELLVKIRAKKQGYLDRLRALERESDGIASVLRAAQAGQTPVIEVPTLRTPLDKPLSLSSPFGMRLHPIFQEQRMHTGADLNGASGDRVRAVKAGVVMAASTMDGYGNVVVIDHGDQIATVYAHLSAFDVRFGDTVEVGQLIGRVGSTGYSTGPHLHLELRVSGAPVDPMPHVDPRSCAALFASNTEADVSLLRNRKECVPPTTTTAATTTLTPAGR